MSAMDSVDKTANRSVDPCFSSSVCVSLPNLFSFLTRSAYYPNKLDLYIKVKSSGNMDSKESSGTPEGEQKENCNSSEDLHSQLGLKRAASDDDHASHNAAGEAEPFSSNQKEADQEEEEARERKNQKGKRKRTKVKKDVEEEEELFDEDLFEEESIDGYFSVGSDGPDYGDLSGVMRLEEDFGEAANVKLPHWLEIARYLDRNDLMDLDQVPPLKGYGLLVRAERRTKDVLDAMERCPKRGYKNCENDPLFQLDISRAFGQCDPSKKPEYFYEWSADDCKFMALEDFEKFCEFAGVDPSQCVELHIHGNWKVDMTYHFLSSDKKVILSCRMDPRVHDGRMEYLGVTGERSRVLRLRNYLMDVAACGDGVWAPREDHNPFYVW